MMGLYWRRIYITYRKKRRGYIDVCLHSGYATIRKLYKRKPNNVLAFVQRPTCNEKTRHIATVHIKRNARIGIIAHEASHVATSYIAWCARKNLSDVTVSDEKMATCVGEIADAISRIMAKNPNKTR